MLLFYLFHIFCGSRRIFLVLLLGDLVQVTVLLLLKTEALRINSWMLFLHPPLAFWLSRGVAFTKIPDLGLKVCRVTAFTLQVSVSGWLALCMRIFATLSHLKRDQNRGGILRELRIGFCHLKWRKERRIGMDQSWAVCWEGMQAEKRFGIYDWSEDEQQMRNLELLFGQSQLAKHLSHFCNAFGKIRKRSFHSQQVRFGLLCWSEVVSVKHASKEASKPHQSLWAPVISSRN